MISRQASAARAGKPGGLQRPPDLAAALVPGPWEHHFVSAGAARFHFASTGPSDLDAPLVVLLHGFPQFWWAWRHQLTALGEAGYRTVAVDLRGYGASDKPPAGNNLPDMAADIAAVIGSLGAREAVVIGQGLGGLVAWTMTAYCPNVLTAVAILDSPHPANLTLRLSCFTSPRALAQAVGFLIPLSPKRALRHGDMVSQCLNTWAANGWSNAAAVSLYRDLMRVPFAAAKAIDQIRWLRRTPLRGESRRFLAQMKRPTGVPILHLQGGLDHFFRPSSMPAPRLGGATYHFERLDGYGHFLPEEAPDQVTSILRAWLERVT